MFTSSELLKRCHLFLTKSCTCYAQITLSRTVCRTFPWTVPLLKALTPFPSRLRGSLGGLAFPTEFSAEMQRSLATCVRDCCPREGSELTCTAGPWGLSFHDTEGSVSESS